jgi:oligopeptide transport system substrate-binding protein
MSVAIRADSVDYGQQKIRIAMLQEPPSLNSMRVTDLVSYFVLGHTMEGLLRYDRRGRLSAGIAESWVVEADKLTFNLRRDALWQNGRAITAHDFVYAWRIVNDPAEAAPFAAIMLPLKNAEKVQRGDLPVNALGVQAIDDFTLVVELERSCGYCLSLMSHGTFFPVQPEFYQQAGPKYGSEAAHLLSNGPFVLEQWVHESRLLLKKNDRYWNKDAITLNEIEIGYITSDNRTRLNLFRDGQIAYARLGAETVRDAVNQRLKIKTFLSGGVAYLWFNMRDDHPTASKPLRQAIQASFDADRYVNQVIAIPGYKPTNTLFPSWFRGINGKFVEEFPPPDVVKNNERALVLLKQAVASSGEIPRLKLLTVSSPTGARAAEYLQGVLRQTLGLDVLVDQQSFKQYLNKARAGEFDLVLSSWYPDFDDLTTYADLLGSRNANNRGRFSHPEYDRYLLEFMTTVEPAKRFGAAAELQRIIVEDVPVLPMAETGSAYLQHPRLKGVVRRVFGPDPDFTQARVLP